MIYLRPLVASAILVPLALLAAAPARAAEVAKPLVQEQGKAHQRERRGGHNSLELEEHGAAASGVTSAKRLLEEKLASIRLMRRAEGRAEESEARRTYIVRVHPGLPGPSGGVGMQGLPGHKGWRGPRGVQGYFGPNGPPGEHGFDGVRGATGTEFDGNSGARAIKDPNIAEDSGLVSATTFIKGLQVCIGISVGVLFGGYFLMVPSHPTRADDDGGMMARKKPELSAEEQGKRAAERSAADARRSEEERAASDNRRELDESTAWDAGNDGLDWG